MSKILIIEDEVDLLELYCELLTDAGHEVTVCENGTEGSEELHKNQYDLVISDKNMGKISGLDLLKLCERKAPKTPFYLVTGDNSENISFVNPKSLILKKPFGFGNLMKLIDDLDDESAKKAG